MKRKSKAVVFLDSTVFFKSIEDNTYKRYLIHIKNDGYQLVTSITVLGETFAKCFGDSIGKLYDIVDLLKELDLNFLHPPPLHESPNLSQVRACCCCLDRVVEEKGVYGSSLTDRTHLAYAVAYGCDYFLTSGKEPSALKLLDDECPNKLEVCNIETLRGFLGHA
jgi:predicted nucleic acid-binding protein